MTSLGLSLKLIYKETDTKGRERPSMQHKREHSFNKVEDVLDSSV